jgi:nucleoside-diphosphate-sugar epimerase
MTSLGAAIDLRRFNQTFAVTNRLRTEGLVNLLAGAKQAGTRRIVAQSFCGWPYAREGGPVKSEDDPLDLEPPRQLQRTLDAIRYLENTVVGSREIEGIVLRYGAFYGPNTGLLYGLWADDRSIAASARAANRRRRWLVVVPACRRRGSRRRDCCRERCIRHLQHRR